MNQEIEVIVSSMSEVRKKLAAFKTLFGRDPISILFRPFQGASHIPTMDGDVWGDIKVFAIEGNGRSFKARIDGKIEKVIIRWSEGSIYMVFT